MASPITSPKKGSSLLRKRNASIAAQVGHMSWRGPAKCVRSAARACLTVSTRSRCSGPSPQKTRCHSGRRRVSIRRASAQPLYEARRETAPITRQSSGSPGAGHASSSGGRPGSGNNRGRCTRPRFVPVNRRCPTRRRRRHSRRMIAPEEKAASRRMWARDGFRSSRVATFAPEVPRLSGTRC
jgi:hypothetical protein